MSIYQSVNPATGEVLASFPLHTDQEMETAIGLAATAFADWRFSTMPTRAAVLERFADLLEEDKHGHAALLTAEMGKTLVSAVGEVEKCASACRWYAQNAPALLASDAVDLPTGRGEVRRLPLGVVLAVMPWNFPFWQVVRFLAPALMAGNAAILKHAPSTPQSALRLVELLAQAGLPQGVFQTLFLDNDQAATAIADPRIAAVTLTGSERAGEAVAAAAARGLKKCVLELGGSDPLIVMPSADLARAARTAVAARNQNNGQSCVCAKRFIVHEAVYDAFVEAITAATKRLKIGDPLAPETDIGPLSTAAARDRLTAQVDAAVEAGGRILAGGETLPGPGAYYPPTIIADLPSGSAITREEFFGPVAMVFKAADLDEAIGIANDIPYGLGSSVWTEDPDEQEAFIARLECGMTFINTMTASDPRLPFGGLKRSGYGRELGRWGMEEFVNLKTVVLAAAGGQA